MTQYPSNGGFHTSSAAKYRDRTFPEKNNFWVEDATSSANLY